MKVISVNRSQNLRLQIRAANCTNSSVPMVNVSRMTKCATDETTAETGMTRPTSVRLLRRNPRDRSAEETSSCATTESASITDSSATESGIAERERTRPNSASPTKHLQCPNVKWTSSCAPMGCV